MRCRRLLPAFLLTAFAGPQAVAADPPPDPAGVEFFEKRVRPLLAEHCHKCHGPDKDKGGLRLDTRANLLAGGTTGPVVVPGEPDKSRLVAAVRYSGELKMPPKSKLSDEQVATLAAWVKKGAPWPEAATNARPAATAMKVTDKDRAFWSFRPVKKPDLPAVRDQDWAKSPIDHFVLAKLEEKGLKPVASADKRTLIRRATFDLTGLPPTPEEVEAFLADDSPDAFAKVVDRLLASPHYGERWGRHWLDVARYGEDQAHTFQSRKYPDGFRYRDWVVRAFNADVPYDRFVTEQIAGDLLARPESGWEFLAAFRAPPDPDRLAATGYFALGPVYYGRATADELDDRVDTLTRGFLGLTVSCARCHDHKFDPIPQRDYYSLAGVFASTGYKEYVLKPDGGIDPRAVSDPTDKMARDKSKDPRKPVVHALAEGTPANMRVHLRGNPANLGEEAPRRFLTVLAGDDPTPFRAGSGRLELARAVASKDNPLTARVMVNRIWMHHFGRGIVNTPSNFGALGERPSHPELLDWLAFEFMNPTPSTPVATGVLAPGEPWSLKRIHRLIMLSATYRLAAKHDERAAAVDADNRLLWRANRRQLEVEPWRDAMLAVAGNLDPKLGGPPADLSAPANNRRTLYGAVSRHNLDPLLRLFDFPDPNLTSDRRPVTSVPLQQLFVLNSPFVARQAKAFADRVTATASDDAVRIRTAFLLAYGRPPTDREVRLGKEYLAAAGADAWEKYAQVLLAANEFAFVD